MSTVYLIGSLRNPQVPAVAKQIRDGGFTVFDDWYAAGPEADDYWRDYEKNRGRTYPEALRGLAAQNVFAFDLRNLEAADAAVLLMPGGKSAHLELGFMLGRGKPGFVLFTEEPERWDVMYQFANGVHFDTDELISDLKATLQD
ncbi:hypothetical protein [Bradyrhizobium sp. SZCCHNRI2049]|uniref:hypothetical protein n=1 Tax=Bradyrhizobium sp. SZCCHNRI2049 TaxID=3057287 RepID=UPI0029167C2C|nr:hypothetical protein [Bradyrhizobium sp. SZCCHNRI2049]